MGNYFLSGHAYASLLFRFFAMLFLAWAGFTCKNQITTQELVDANFLAKGQTPIDLLSPSENQQVTRTTPTLSWSSKGVSLYSLQMATDANFNGIVLDKEVSGTSYTVENADLSGVSSLATNTYYWRVKVARIASNLQSKTGTFFLVAIPTSGSGYAGALYVNGGSNNSLQVGSKEAPYKKIQTAIGAADALRDNNANVSVDIFVAQGTYTEEINLAAGISIRGGYSASDWTRNIAANTTTIQAPIDIAIKSGPAVTAVYASTTWVEGFTIQGAAATTSYGIYLASSYTTISKNTISGGATSSGSSIGIGNYASSPTISNNTIAGGAVSGGYASVGIDNNNSSSPTISNNIIAGGAAPSGGSYGINNSSSSPTISNNTITTATANSSNGIYNLSSSPTISNNTITTGGTSSGNSGIIMVASSSTISSNTIIVGASSNISYGINMSMNCTPTIRNNNIYLTGKSPFRYGIYESSASDNPVGIKNNNIFDIGTGGNFYVYRDADGSCSGGATPNCTSITNMEADLNAEAAGTASGNINQNSMFLNFPNKVDMTVEGADAGAIYDGTTTTLEVTNCTDYVVTEYLEYDKDGVVRQITACSTATGSGIATFTPALSSASVATREVRLWGTNNSNLVIDLHLKATSPCDVRQGGLDLSAFFTTDRDNVSRTATLTCGPANSGATGWSIGAYEY